MRHVSVTKRQKGRNCSRKLHIGRGEKEELECIRTDSYASIPAFHLFLMQILVGHRLHLKDKVEAQPYFLVTGPIYSELRNLNVTKTKPHGTGLLQVMYEHGEGLLLSSVPCPRQ